MSETGLPKIDPWPACKVCGEPYAVLADAPPWAYTLSPPPPGHSRVEVILEATCEHRGKPGAGRMLVKEERRLDGKGEPERPKCGTCPYFQDFDADGDGECRRNAPALPPTETLAKEIGPYGGDFPGTSRGKWCGEHPDFPAYIADLGGQP